jgi:NAD+ synthase (glutamine-hydrolysing)
VLAIAVDALSQQNVTAVMLPSRYTAEMSMEDGLALISNVGVAHEVISIEPSFKAFLETLKSVFGEKEPDITEENLQARCRGIILMALSNKEGSMVLSTSNRSELAMGYGTLYGDMVGGFNVLKDVPKTWVYRLAAFRNKISPIIPARIIDRAPSAELRPNQKDEDTLPPYEILDQILELYIEKEKGVKEIIAEGFSPDMVNFVVRAIQKNEYKRRQGSPGVRINHKAFGRDRRYPMTMRDPELS